LRQERIMTLRRIVTGLLLAFVVASVGFLIYQETRAGGKGAAAPTGDRVVAYYFHGTARCPTCRKIEAYTQEALETAFAAEIAAGKLEWRPINVEDPGNEHFVQDFGITGKTVVLAKIRGGAVARFAKLDRTWKLVRDKAEFVDYIVAETRAYLGPAR
jgi:hypothetical protein